MVKEVEMLYGDLARYRIEDRLREAEAERIARAVRRSRSAEASLSRRVARAAMAAATWPAKH